MITLGISYQMHDSAAALSRDGEILCALAEERVSRIKHDAGFPVHAIRACLNYAGIKPDQIDYIVYGWPPAGRLFRHDLQNFVSGSRRFSRSNFTNSLRRYLSMSNQKGGATRFSAHFGATRARVLHIDHHLAHAISAYAYSGFSEATVVVVDGRGAFEATSIWHGRDGLLTPVQIIPWPNSIGLFYAEFTHYLGFTKYSDEWKVMGLAPYGQPGISLREFIEPDDSPYKVNSRRLIGRNAADASGIESILGPRRAPESEITERDRNIAWAVQDASEVALLSIARYAVAKTGCRDMCLAGGVALNSKANGKLNVSGLVDRLFVQPASADDGIALGAALYPHLETDGRLPVAPMRHAYLGLEFSDADILTALRTYKIRHSRLEDPARVAAQLLADGKILGWFQGRMEFGPRALGSRSLLADPRDPEMKDKVNNAVKFREPWRPFAPSMLAPAAQEFLEHAGDAPFMIVTYQVKPEKQSVIPAVTHADGSARPQTVYPDVNPLYHRMIQQFGEITGVPVVMNTSFNLRGEAIVNSPTDALRTFFSSGLDALVLGSYLIEK